MNLRKFIKRLCSSRTETTFEMEDQKRARRKDDAHRLCCHRLFLSTSLRSHEPDVRDRGAAHRRRNFAEHGALL
jgi:hypothetical protein